MSTPSQRPDDPTSAWRLVFGAGFSVALGSAAGVLGGRYLSEWAGGSPLLLAGSVLLGVLAGLAGAIALLLKEAFWNH